VAARQNARVGLLKTGFITTVSTHYGKNMTTITAVSILIRTMSIVVKNIGLS